MLQPEYYRFQLGQLLVHRNVGWIGRVFKHVGEPWVDTTKEGRFYCLGWSGRLPRDLFDYAAMREKAERLVCYSPGFFTPHGDGFYEGWEFEGDLTEAVEVQANWWHEGPGQAGEKYTLHLQQTYGGCHNAADLKHLLAQIPLARSVG